MRGTTSARAVGFRDGPSGRPWTSTVFRRASPSSGPSGHLPPRGGKDAFPTSSPLAGEDRPRSGQMRGTTRKRTVGTRGSPFGKPLTVEGVLSRPPPHPALRATFPREGGRPFFPTSSPLAGEDRPRSGQMRGTTRKRTVGTRGSPFGKPLTVEGVLSRPPPHPALRATFPREGGRPFFPTSSPLAGEDRPRSGQMRGTTRKRTVGTRGSPFGKPLTVEGVLSRPPPHPALRATFPREGGRPFFPTRHARPFRGHAWMVASPFLQLQGQSSSDCTASRTRRTSSTLRPTLPL